LAEKGSHPSLVRQQQFISAHIYGAVCPATGKTEALISPVLSMEMMQKNPIEQVWAWLRDNDLANFAFKDYEHIVEQVSRGWNNFRHQVGRVKRSVKGSGQI
jgi:hypothetical protein